MTNPKKSHRKAKTPRPKKASAPHRNEALRRHRYNDALLVKFAEKLQEAIRESWLRAVAEHGGERIYAYVLFTEPLLGYVAPSFSSETALRRDMKGSTDKGKRWRPVEWEYHLEHNELFDGAQQALNQLNTPEYYDQGKNRQRRWRVFLRTLKQLDSEGLFGVAEQRQKLTVNIMWGDEDAAAHVRSARELNPLRSYLRYARTQLPWMKRVKAEIEKSGSEAVYRKQALARVSAAIAMVEKDLRLAK